MKVSEQIDKMLEDTGLAIGGACDTLRGNKPGAAADTIEALGVLRCEVERMRVLIAENMTGNGDIDGLELLGQLGEGLCWSYGDDKLGRHAARVSEAIRDLMDVARQEREKNGDRSEDAENVRAVIG